VRLSGRPAGVFGPAENVLTFPADPQVASFKLAIDAKGDAVVVSLASRLPRSFVYAAYRQAGGKFGASKTLTEASGQTGPNGQLFYVNDVDAAIDSRGGAVATWWNSGRIQAAFRSASGAWQSPHDLGRPGACCTGPTIAVDARGNAVAAWIVSRAGTVQASTLAAGSRRWRTPQILSRPGDRALSEAPAVAVGARGDVVVAWAANRTPAAIVAAVRPRGGRFAPSQDVWHGPGFARVGPPQVAVDPQGNATALWGTTPSPLPRDSHSGYIQAAGYDAAGPQLRGLRIPASASVGGVLHLSVVPLDVWSGVSKTRWNFGDGAYAVGQRVQHAYRHPDSYQVIVTSTDRLGNATRARRTMLIGPR